MRRGRNQAAQQAVCTSQYSRAAGLVCRLVVTAGCCTTDTNDRLAWSEPLSAVHCGECYTSGIHHTPPATHSLSPPLPPLLSASISFLHRHPSSTRPLLTSAQHSPCTPQRPPRTVPPPLPLTHHAPRDSTLQQRGHTSHLCNAARPLSPPAPSSRLLCSAPPFLYSRRARLCAAPQSPSRLLISLSHPRLIVDVLPARLPSGSHSPPRVVHPPVSLSTARCTVLSHPPFPLMWPC